MNVVRRAGIIGDVHAQHEARSAALDFVRSKHVDQIFAVGDIVDGLGDVNRCCELLSAPDIATVRGNHERWFLRGQNLTLPNATHDADVDLTSRAFLASLETKSPFTTPGGPALLCHALGDDDMTVLDPDEPTVITLSRRGVSDLVATYRFIVHGHSHRRGVAHVETATFINAGTLVPVDDPCFGIVDFEAGVVQYYEFDRALRIAPAESTSLRRVDPRERDTQPPRGASPRWKVLIVYREPTYEAERGLPPTEYRASFEVNAAHERDAKAAGLVAFRNAVRVETVGWPREIVRVECVRLEEGR
jgi:predicted phosphodiesterase